MIDITRIEKLVNEYTEGSGIFLVIVKVTTGNKITVLINKKGGITIDECVKLSKHVETNLDRESEDFDLKVSSPGIGEPLLVKEQFEMSVGRRLEVINSDGEKYIGELKSFSGDSFKLEIKQKIKGKKRELIDKLFEIENTRSVKELITFKQ